MTGFIVISKNEKEVKVSCVEGLRVIEVLQMLQLVQQHFTNLLIQETMKEQKEEIKEGP